MSSTAPSVGRARASKARGTDQRAAEGSPGEVLTISPVVCREIILHALCMSGQLPSGVTAVIEAELISAAASVQVLQMEVSETVYSLLQDDGTFRFDLSLTQRLRSGMCFLDHWPSNRFERPGKVFVLPPTEKLHVRSGIGSQKAVICNLHKDIVARYLDAELDWTDERLEASLDIADRALVSTLLQLGDEARNPGLASDVLCEALAVQLAVSLYRNFADISDTPRSGGLSPWRLALITDRVRSEGGSPTLAELADLCGLSVRHLTRAFRESRGTSLGTYVAAHKIERAKELLTSGANLKSVSYQLGFASPSSFSQAFRKSTGWTPGAFQQRLLRPSRAH